MRRALAILLVLFFGLGPLSAVSEAGGDLNLPACCRRHGEHHCAMSAAMMAMVASTESGSGPALTAPPTCPYFPGFHAVPAVTSHALLTLPAPLPAVSTHLFVCAVSRTSVQTGQNGSHAGRGPPLWQLS